MRLLKKVRTILLCVCMLVPVLGMTALAADGRISFSDPQTAVGDEVEVKCVVKSSGSSLGDVEVTFSYDSDSLRFVSGEDVTKTANGTLVYSGDGSGTEVSFVMTFQAKKQGSTKITVSGSNVSSASGSNLTFDAGNSTVTIAAGDPSKVVEEEEDSEDRVSSGQSIPVQVNGENYTLTDTFEEIDIPNGFTETSVTYENTQCTMVMQEASQIYLAWLVDDEDNGEFFLFDNEKATFAPYEQVMISDTTTIVLLSDESLELPEQYELTTLKLNDKEFPVWQDMERDGYYLMYAVNNTGEKALYRYDLEEGTYQKFDLAAEEQEQKQEEEPSKGFVQDFVNDHFSLAAIVVGAILLILLLILIIVGVKLSHRNGELDDLYDKYGIDLGDDGEYVPVDKKKKNNKKASKKSRKAKEDDFDDEDDFDEDDFDDEDSFEDDEYEEERYADDSFDRSRYADDSYDEEEDDDEFIDDDFDIDAFDDQFSDDDFDESEFVTARFDQKKVKEYNTLTALNLDEYEDRDDYGIDAYADEAADDMIEDLDEHLSKKTPSSRKRVKKDESYTVDFIDLD